MFKSIQSTIHEFAASDIFLSEIAATAFSHKGKRLCRDMGMKFLHRHPRALRSEIADVYHMTGLEMVEGYVGRNKGIANAYKREFGP